jgi:GNAT superfamily N-acetyltransferase/ABC-type lipoprotein export system ATPase subunit
MSYELKSEVMLDDITVAISAMFDYEFDGRSAFLVPMMPEVPEQFGIGLLVGPSGSGKSSLLRRFGKEQTHLWANNMAVASHFSDADDAAERLSAVGFSSIPSWLRPYHVLSTGEKFRADLARQLRDNAVIDEYTSVVDRNVAKACSVALRRYVDKKRLRNVVLASCHYDIVEWLQPDWVFDTSTGQLAGRGSVRRPAIELEVVPCTADIWPMFRQHHYLDGNINRSARCWVAVWGGIPVGFASALRFPNGNFSNGWREHRTVILPDYQGLGLGVRLSDAVAQMFVADGYRYFSKTAHRRLGEYREASPNWKATSKNKKNRIDYRQYSGTKEDGHKMRHVERVCYSHEYVGTK